MITRRRALLVTSSYLSYTNAFAQNDKSAIKLLVGASAGTDATAYKLISSDRTTVTTGGPLILSLGVAASDVTLTITVPTATIDRKLVS
jgi:hypothetical protein